MRRSTLLEESAAASGYMNFGLRMAESRQLSRLRRHQLADQSPAHVAGCPRHHHRLPAPSQRKPGDADRGGGGGWRSFAVEVVAHVPARQATELGIGVLFRMCAALMGARWQPDSVNFTHSAPSPTCDCIAACSPAEWNSTASSVASSFLRRTWTHRTRPLIRPWPAMLGSSSKPCPSASDNTIVLEVRRAVYLTLPMGRATSECVAQGLGLSVRSMQRQLDEAGASFTSLVNEVRCDLAPRYIDNPDYSLQRILNSSATALRAPSPGGSRPSLTRFHRRGAGATLEEVIRTGRP